MTLTLEASSSAWKRRCLRNRLRYALISVALFAVFFVAHQLLYFKQLNDSLAIARRADEQNKWKQPRHSKPIRSGNHEIPVVSLRGTRNNDLGWYLPDTRGKFHCISTGEKIAFTKVNDDYCDCPDDGSDEPGTNACNRGVFYCEAVPVETGVSAAESLMYPAKIASYKVNDGVCDCCDGSDEWDSKVHLFLGDSRHTIGLLECPDKCGDS